MQSFLIFGLRLLISVFVAVIIGRMFFHGTPVFKVSLLALALLGLAYLFEYIGKRNKPGNHS
jgi:hypothetical protein